MRAILAALAVCLAGCSNAAEDEVDGSAYEMSAAEAAEAAAGEPDAPAFTPDPEPPLPTHNYSDRDGLIYSYVAAVSEEDRKRGRAAGDVVSFAYLGRRDGKHTLAQVDTYGRILGYSYCSQPCRIITYSDGSQVGYTETSIIGSAFADAIAGNLKVAQENAPRNETPSYSTPPPSPTSVPNPAATPEPEPYFEPIVDPKTGEVSDTYMGEVK